MPPIPFRPGARTLYPDTSTLIYAFNGAAQAADAGDRAILFALHEVASKANLCLSLPHLLELQRVGDAKKVLADAAVLDSIEIVWLVRQDIAEELEVENFLRGTVAGAVGRPRLPWVPSFLSQFRELNPEAAAEYLATNTIAAFLTAAVADKQHMRRLEEMAALGKSYSQRLFEDRNRARLEKVSKAEIDAQLDRNLLAYITEVARRIHCRIIAAADPNYLVRYGVLEGPPEFEALRKLVPLPSDAPQLFPTFFLFHRVIRSFAEEIARKANIGTGFFHKRDGDFFDWSHLVGAAYADAFCCDSLTAKHLGNARTTLGLPEPLVLTKGDKGRLADQILSTVFG